MVEGGGLRVNLVFFVEFPVHARLSIAHAHAGFNGCVSRDHPGYRTAYMQVFSVWGLQGYLTYKKTPLGPYRRPMPRVVGGSQGDVRFLMGEVPLHRLCRSSSRKGEVPAYVERTETKKK